MNISVFIACSLDGFIARENGEIDWLMNFADPDAEPEDHGYYDFFNSVDALVMGRGTFEKVLTFGDWPYGDKKVYVISNSLSKLPESVPPTVELTTESPEEIYTRLANLGIKKIYLDGGKLIQSFLRENLVDELIISQIPVLIGSGLPLFGETENDIRLSLVDSKKFRSGMVQNHYRVIKE